MSDAASEQTRRNLDLLRRLEGSGALVRGTEVAVRPEGGEAGAGQESPGSCRITLDPWFPAAERWSWEGASCRCVRTGAGLDGRATAQGYRCPVESWFRDWPPEALGAAIAELTGEPAWATVEPGQIAFIDTETTGLGTGAGTCAFLVGVGGFERAPGGGWRFGVEQYFMEDFDGEPALIEALENRLRGMAAVVTYNGTTFDLPLLETRWRMQRRRPRLPPLHLDLLHYARRLWRGVLPDCSLGTVERRVLGIERLSDVPGMLVPQIWLDFQYGIAPERIVPVFDHHAQDIYSMAALVALMARAMRQPDDDRFGRPETQWGLARLELARGRRDGALSRLGIAAQGAANCDDFALAMRIARALKRLRSWPDATAIWQAWAPRATPTRLEPLVELAKYAEHREHDYAAALEWTRQAMAILEAAIQIEMPELRPRKLMPSNTRRPSDELAKRHARLCSKSNRV